MASSGAAASSHSGSRVRPFPAGFVVHACGYPTGFVTLAAIGLAGFAFFALLMPETRPEAGRAGQAEAPATA